MIKNIVILGSTGSIGKNTIEILKKNKKKINIRLLSTNKNISEIIKQALEFNVKHVIVSDRTKFIEARNKYKNLKIKFYHSFSIIDKLFKKKEIYYSMVSLVGFDGLYPCLKLIKFCKNIGIVNKESIICGWKFIKEELHKNNVNFVPIDSEHYSIYTLIKNTNSELIDKIFITASGGPFLNKSIKQMKNVKKKNALNHPNWKMGKKITIDSSTMMNKVFEVIEAKKLFNVKYSDIEILTHPNSYVHAIIKLKNSIIKLIAHYPDMKIPIHNSIFPNKKNNFSNVVNLKILNNLQLKKIDKKKFPLVKILNKLQNNDSLYETVLVTINDYFVSKFLLDEITFNKMIKLIYKYSNSNDFLKYRMIKPKKIEDIYNLNKNVSLKLRTLSI